MLYQVISCLRFTSICPIVRRSIHTTSVVCAEPPKKKKKLDIQIVKMRVERRIRKIEKEIRRLKKTPKQLKPIEEYQLPPHIMKELKVRKRVLTEEDEKITENVEKLSRLFGMYHSREKRREARDIKIVMAAQQKALDVLKSESLELYLKALEIDETLLPFDDQKIITETPKNPDYKSRDGLRTDVSKVWTM